VKRVLLFLQVCDLRASYCETGIVVFMPRIRHMMPSLRFSEDLMAIARTVDRRLFFVLDRTFLQIAQAADKALSEGSGVGRAQAAVLVYLGYHDGCTLTELSEGTGRRNAAITGLVDRMEAVDLISRKQSYGDRRQRTVHLTDKGWTVREAVMADFRDFNTQLTRGLTETETAAVMKFLSQSVGNVQKKSVSK